MHQSLFQLPFAPMLLATVLIAAAASPVIAGHKLETGNSRALAFDLNYAVMASASAESEDGR